MLPLFIVGIVPCKGSLENVTSMLNNPGSTKRGRPELATDEVVQRKRLLGKGVSLFMLVWLVYILEPITSE